MFSLVVCNHPAQAVDTRNLLISLKFEPRVWGRSWYGYNQTAVSFIYILSQRTNMCYVPRLSIVSHLSEHAR